MCEVQSTGEKLCSKHFVLAAYPPLSRTSFQLRFIDHKDLQDSAPDQDGWPEAAQVSRKTSGQSAASGSPSV